MAVTSENYGELFSTGEWADTSQSSVVVKGADGVVRHVSFMVHGGNANVDLTLHPTNPDGMAGVVIEAFVYLADGTLERTVTLPNTWSLVADPTESTELLRYQQAIFAVGGADFIDATTGGGFAYVLYGPGVEPATFGNASFSTACSYPFHVAASSPDPDPRNRITIAFAPYSLQRLDVATGSLLDLTPSPMGTLLTQADLLYDSGGSSEPHAYISLPVLAYKQMFYACTSSILAYGSNIWWGRAEPSVFPSTLFEMSPYSGGTNDQPGSPEKILNITFPTSSRTLSGAQIVKHQFGARHIPMESFSYRYVALNAGTDLAINNPKHLVSYVHPARMPATGSSVFQWVWTVNNAVLPAVDPEAQVPDNASVGDRYDMVSGCVSIDTPFLFANARRGLTTTVATEGNPAPPPSATQFIVPVRDGSGLSKDWRWFQNMPSANPFFNVPTGVIHLYLVDPVNSLWNYLGPAKEATGGTGAFFTGVSASGPYLTSQRTSRIVNLDGVLACTSLFGAMKPTMNSTLRDMQEGYDTAYPASTTATAGFTEELWLVCSNDGTNWVKVQKLTEPLNSLAVGKEGDSISLKAGTTLLIGYGPRQCPIASAPCLITKPVGG